MIAHPVCYCIDIPPVVQYWTLYHMTRHGFILPVIARFRMSPGSQWLSLTDAGYCGILLLWHSQRLATKIDILLHARYYLSHVRTSRKPASVFCLSISTNDFTAISPPPPLNASCNQAWLSSDEIVDPYVGHHIYFKRFPTGCDKLSAVEQLSDETWLLRTAMSWAL